MTQREAKKVAHGLYEIFWKSGGSSLAAVGSNANGYRWVAPTNWIVISDKINVWKNIKYIRLICNKA